MGPAGIPLDRIRYWRGQTLASRDLRDQLGYDAALRWWHNRAIHDTYGVVFGYFAAVDGARVVVGRGLAYDCFGRELILRQPARLELPPQDPGTPERSWRLLIRAESNGEPGGSPPELAWLPTGGPPRPTEGVPVASGSWRGTEFRIERSRDAQRVLPLSRPRLGSGETVHGSTDWRLWTRSADAFGRRSLVGVEVTVDTAAAGFRTTPCYFASLRGDPWIAFGRSVVVALGRIVEETPRRFVFSLWLPIPTTPVFSTTAAVGAPPLVQLARRQWSLCWIGIENPPVSLKEARPR